MGAEPFTPEDQRETTSWYKTPRDKITTEKWGMKNKLKLKFIQIIIQENFPSCRNTTAEIQAWYEGGGEGTEGDCLMKKDISTDNKQKLLNFTHKEKNHIEKKMMRLPTKEGEQISPRLLTANTKNYKALEQ